MWPTTSGAGTNLNVGRGAHPAQSAGNFLSCPFMHLFDSTGTISFGERFRDGQYTVASFLFAVLLLAVPPFLQPFVKVGARAPMPSWVGTTGYHIRQASHRAANFLLNVMSAWSVLPTATDGPVLQHQVRALTTCTITSRSGKVRRVVYVRARAVTNSAPELINSFLHPPSFPTTLSVCIIDFIATVC